MLDPTHPLAELLRRDNRYHRDSYVFVFDSLRFAQEKLDMGRVVAPSPGRDSSEDFDDFDDELDVDELEAEDLADSGIESARQRHVTGQDLCEAMRRYALSQYGLLAKSVLNHWGIHSTEDFGEIVFNLIDIGQMHKTEGDRREDFCNVFDFEQDLTDGKVFHDESLTQRDDEE